MNIPNRQSHTLFLEILTDAPLTHGQGSNGNEQEILRREVRISHRDSTTGKWRSSVENIPMISGASFRAKLRQQALMNACALMMIPDGSFDKDKWRLLTKGGHLDGSGKAVNVEETRQICEMFPMLRLFGAMDNSLRLTGSLKVDHVTPYCRELLYGGLIPESEHFRFWMGDPNDPTWPAFADEPPSYLEAVGTKSVQYYRHDGSPGPAARLLATADRRQIADNQAKIAALVSTGAKVDKEERREANESMPHAFQAIIKGTPLYTILRTDPITDVEFACLIHALGSWKQMGAHLGGAEAKGHGHCRVRIAGSFTSGANKDATEPTELVIPNETDPHAPLRLAYEAHMKANAERARKWITE